uniref:Uncharacterized protein n=1 Tax=Timema genevievae TaxID=629358 RepID=A0A7R9JUU3_TIMGE|nr:unnamed protein product [Timema genevievae]
MQIVIKFKDSQRNAVGGIHYPCPNHQHIIMLPQLLPNIRVSILSMQKLTIFMERSGLEFRPDVVRRCARFYVEGEGKTTLSTPDEDSNPDLPVIGGSVQLQSDAWLRPCGTQMCSAASKSWRLQFTILGFQRLVTNRERTARRDTSLDRNHSTTASLLGGFAIELSENVAFRLLQLLELKQTKS